MILMIICLAFKLVKDCFLQASELNIIQKRRKKYYIIIYRSWKHKNYDSNHLTFIVIIELLKKILIIQIMIDN